MERIRIYALTLLLTIVAMVAQAQPTSLPGSTGLSCDESDGVYGVLNIWGSMFDSNVPNAIGWQDWGGCTIGSDININGATIKTITFVNGYSGSGWVGYVLSNDPANVTVDLSAATEMNVWVWSKYDTEIGLEFQSATNQNADTHKYKSSRTLPVTGGKWNLISVPLSKMQEQDGTGSSLVDIKNFSIVQNFSEQTEHTIYVSDIFFTKYRDFVNGQRYRLFEADASWYVMRDFFSRNNDGTYTFNAISGYYHLVRDAGKKFVKVEPLNADGSAVSEYSTSTGEGALWLAGSGGFGMPNYTVNAMSWGPNNKLAMAEVGDKVYQTTMTIGTELNPTDGEFKVFESLNGWGADGFKPSSSTGNKSGTIDYVNGNHYIFNIADNGNITKKSGATLRTGDDWQIEVGVKEKDSNNKYNLSFSANRVWLNTGDLQPASAPTDASDKVLSVFSDTYGTNNLGMKMSGYSHVVNWGQSERKQYTTDDPAHRSIDYRTYADNSNDQVAVFEFKVDDSDVHREWLNLHFNAQDLSDYKYLHIDVNDLDGLNNEIYIWPRKSNDYPRFEVESEAGSGNYDQAGPVQGVPALKFNLLTNRDANGWKSIDIPLSAIIGLDGITGLTDIDHIGIQAVGGVKGALAIDNVYFTKEKKTFTTYDNDERGIDWNTATGTTCYVDQIVWTKSGPTAGLNIVDTYNDNWAKIHDGDVHSYFQFNHDDTNDENEHSQILIQLKDDIRVSDVEVIWANGYASRYAVYAFENYPVVNGEIPSTALTPDSGNLLYYVGGYETGNAEDDIQMDHEPYYVIKSELQEKVTHNSRYILLDLRKRGNGDTFGYYIDEVHVGAYDEDYNKPDHLNFPVTVIQTELPPTELNVTVRNKRNAVLSKWTSKIVPGSVKTSWDSPLLKKHENNETKVYATSPGDYAVTVTGSVEDVTDLKPGESAVKAYKNWKPASEGGKWKSLVQPIAADIVGGSGTDAEKQTALNSQIWASQTEDWEGRTYYPWKAADGVEATDDHSRWSSAQKDTNNNNPSNQFWVIDLEKTYELTDVELVWERAIAKTYSVFGFTSLDGVDLDEEYDDFVGKYGTSGSVANHLVYSHKMDNVLEYPYHDQHTNSSTISPVIENNRARYLVVKTKDTQSTKYYEGTSYSIWEVYAWGADVSVTDNVTALKTPNLSVKVGHEGVVDVTAYGTKDGTNIEESEWHPVTFTVPATSKYVLINIPDEDKEGSTGKTVDRFFFFEKVDSYTEEQYKQAYENETIKPLAYIVDNDNGTYGVKVMPGIAGLGQTEGDYDDGRDDSKSITITMSSTSTNLEVTDNRIYGQFELVIYKDAMKLLTDGTSSNKRQVYDDGYYSESVLTNNITAETVTIDLRNVDFSYDNEGNSLSSSVLPAPHTVTKGTGASKVQLNPNTIYYTDETGLVANGNLAVKQDNGTWKVAMLRIFDGWDWEPITNEGGLEATSASFYTSIPANHYSFFTMPFVPDFNTISSKNVKLYKPTAFRPERKAVKIEEMTDGDFISRFEGKPYVIYTEDEANYRPNGYAVVFKSKGEVSVPYWPVNWENNGATFIPTYTKQTLEENDGAYVNYMYSIQQDQFLQVGSPVLAEDEWNGAAGSATELKPFYCYMKAPAQASPAPAFTFMLTDDTETTGIDAAEAETDGTVKVYDVQGRYVSDSSRNLTPGMYIIKRADGSTRKVYIKK